MRGWQRVATANIFVSLGTGRAPGPRFSVVPSAASNFGRLIATLLVLLLPQVLRFEPFEVVRAGGFMAVELGLC